MKIICAGYPKTGSKTCSNALRQLGYNVADYMETVEYLRIVSPLSRLLRFEPVKNTQR